MNKIIYKFLDNNIPGSSHKYNISEANSLEIAENNKNLAIKKTGLLLNHINTVKQVHGCEAIFIDNNIDYSNEILADALVTNKKNITLAVKTADCVPILLADEENEIIAAIHAGHKGAFLGIVENTVKLMHDKGAKKINAHIGPCIKQDSYEVSLDFFEKFISNDPVNKKYFITSAKDQHFLFDITVFVLDILSKLNVNIAHIDNVNTYTNNNYFSFRRYTHSNNTEPYGSNLSIITII
jgi:polyphenol oxidase